MERPPLSFSEIEKHIQEMPDGPDTVLDTPKWIRICNLVGLLGIFIGLAPFLMIQFLQPQMWMVGVARFGFWLALTGSAPGIVRGIAVMAIEFWRWRPKLVEQSDHDLAQFRELRRWLSGYPSAELDEHRRFAKLAQERLTTKLGLLAGGFDKLGILPALFALLVLLSNAGELTVEKLVEVPVWQSLLAFFFTIAYLIGLLAMRMRLCLQLYEVVLDDALSQGHRM